MLLKRFKICLFYSWRHSNNLVYYIGADFEHAKNASYLYEKKYSIVLEI